MPSIERLSFLEDGYLHVPGFHPSKSLASVRQKIAASVERTPLCAHNFKALRKLPAFQQVGKLSNGIHVSGLHETLVTPGLRNLLAEVSAQPGLTARDTQLLLSPPSQGEWTLTGLNWHVDLAAARQQGAPGVQAFFLLDDLAPQGGGTLALAGSHTFPDRSGMMAALRQTSAAGIGQMLQNLGLRIVEMSGRAGDVYLMDMRVLHTPAINSAKRMRMMATCRAFA